MPKNVLGKNTFESIKSGSILGHALMVKSMCEEFEKEVGYPLKKIITGGNSIIIKEFLSKYGFIYDEYLVYEGLSVICEKNK
jgi:type III pantothenate kinase